MLIDFIEYRRRSDSNFFLIFQLNDDSMADIDTKLWAQLRLRLLYFHVVTRNYSSAFEPSRLAPVERMGHTLIATDAIITLKRWAAYHSAQGAWGYGALLKEVD